MFQHNVLSVMPHHLVGPPGSSLNTQHLDNKNSMVVFPIPELYVLVNNRVFFCITHLFTSTLLQECLWWVKVI